MRIRITMYKTFTVNTVRILSLVVGFLMPIGLLAQNFSAYNWYFGNSNRGIRFSRSDNSASLVTNQFTPFGQGGSAVASDPTSGDLLFYTDGVRVIDASHQQMPNGTLTGDNTRNQPVVLCPVPGKNRSQYYIFHRDATGTLRYSLVHLNDIGNASTFGQPPLGDVDNDTINVLVPGLPVGLSEAMIILPNSNEADFWLITHRQGTTDYNVTAVTTAGVGLTTTVITAGFIQRAASFSYHTASKRIAVAPQEAGRNVEVIAFTDTPTPTFTGVSVINSNVSSATTQAIFDTEFSNNGQYLYVSRHGQTAPAIQANVLQYDLTDPTLTAQSVLSNPLPFQSYGLQMGPDSTIYHLYQATSGGPFRLGALTNTDTVASEVNYNPQAFTGDFGGRQFPSFAPPDTLKMKVFFDASGLCANAPTTFYPTVIPDADSLTWDFGDGATSSDWSPVHTYTAGGGVQVKVTAYLNGQAKDTTQTVNINNFDAQISLVQDTAACSCELPFSKKTNPPSPPPSRCGTFTLTAQISGSGSPTWQWYGPAGPGASGSGTSAQLQPDSAGYYYLKVSSGSCYTVAGVNIREYGIQDQRANIWYFGKNAGLDFNPLPDDPVKAISNPVMDTPEGTATVSDRNGQVIFFTDGNTVWARDFSVLGTGIGGDPGSTQSSLIIPVPGNETLYYIFTTQEIYGGQFRLSYSLFDMTVGTFGALVKTNVLLFEKSTERITGNGGWLIAHEFGNNSFRAYPITAQGIGNPVITSIGSDHTNEMQGRGYMKLGPQNRLAVALSTPGVSNVVEVFDFADSTGVVSNFRTLNLNNTTGQVYGVEFGAGGNKLFATLSNPGASKLYEFAFDTLGRPYEIKPPQSANNINEELGAIQIGPDGQLYVAVKGKQYLGMINVNGDTTVTSTFNVSQRPLLPGTSSNLGLPNFTQIISDPTQGPSINVTGLCFGDSTFFVGSGTDPIDTLAWFFGDGSGQKGANLTNVQHLYAAAGTYTVRLRISNRCVGFITELTRTITITLPPVLPLSPVSICTPPQALDANPTNAPNLGYEWSTGDTTKVIYISNQGTYTVTITNKVTGCNSTGDIEAFPSLTTIDLGPDSTVCSSPGGGLTLDTRIAPAFPFHTWRRNGTDLGNTGPTQFVDLSAAGVFMYTVQFDDVGSGCYVRDTVTYTVNPTPGLTVTNNGPLPCGGAQTGQLTATITHTPGTFVSYIVTGASSGFAESSTDEVAGMFNIPTPASLGPDTYTVQVSDQVSGCAITDTEIINSSAFTVTATPVNVCVPPGGAIPVEITSVTPAIPTTAGTYRVILVSSGAVVDSGNKPTTATFSTNAIIPPGNYLVEVTINGCTAGANVTVSPGANMPAAAISTTNLCTASQVTASATGATTFTWSPAAAFTTAPGNSPTATINPGTWQIQVIIDDGPGGNCPTTVTQSVTVDNFTPAFTYNECQDPTTLIASPVGNYFYRWSFGGAPVGTGQQLSVAASDPQGQYTLEMQSIASGCPAKQVASNVIIAGPLSALINTLTLACTGSPFTLEAQPSRPATSFQWQFDGTNIPGATNAQLIDTREGLYTVNVMAGNCPASADLQLLLLPSTPGQMNDDALICPDPANPNPNTRVALLDPGAGFVSYDWFDITGGTPVPLNTTTQTYTALQAGIYLVELENSIGCKSSDRTTVTEECEPVIVGPNAFRPSSAVQKDGELVNQQFRLFTFFIDDDGFQIYIFNRWGEMIFESSNREFRWNGGYKNNLGQLLPAGTYSYVVRYKSVYRPEDGVKEKRGGVLLVR